MRISINWLRELVAVDAAWDEIAERLTRAGLEVEGAHEVGGGYAGVIAVEIRAATRHPKADNLHLVDVFDGRDVVRVVCGAPVLPPVGARVPWARPGATLPGGRSIAARDIRGVTSPGMLCAEDELGLSADQAGLLVLDGALAPGSDVAQALGGPDRVLELNVTPNRADCLGHRGVAREVAALLPGARLIPVETGVPAGHALEATAASLARVTVEDPQGCPRYTARVLDGVTVGKSGLAARLRLESLGVRAISDVVDATNLAMLEIGHPLHAFDLDQLAGHAIVVRAARPGETLVTLDGIERKLTPEDLLICDAERPVAIAGVMGGEGSGITPSTKRLLLESAYFDPTRVRRTARRLGLHTEASHRFERGADPNAGVLDGGARCARMLCGMTGGRVAADVIDVEPRPIAPARVSLRPARTRLVLGVDVAPREQVEMLRRLALDPQVPATDQVPDRFDVVVPTFRPDLTREADLVEEVARLWGYDKIPASLPPLDEAPVPRPAPIDERLRDALAGLGLVEHVGYGFTAPERIAALGWPADDPRSRPLRLANPLGEELSAMRTSLLPGLLAVAHDNQARGTADVQLFEVGTIFLPALSAKDGLPDERLRAAAVLTGARDTIAATGGGWQRAREPLDFFDVKGLVVALLEHLRVGGVRFDAPGREAPWLHPGVGARVLRGDVVVGAFGEVHPDLARKLELDGRVFAFELAVEALDAQSVVAASEPWRFPGSGRDLSFFLPASVPAAAVGELLAGASPLVVAVELREDYRQTGHVPEGQKGMLWSIAYRARDRTLTDDEVGREHQKVVEALRARFAVTLRQ